MEYLLSAASRKAVDAYTINEYGIPGEELVENAARAIEKEIVSRFESARVSIVCGYGNNGADGLALARMLCARGFAVEVRKIGNPLKETQLCSYEAGLLQERIAIRQADEALDCDIIVDAIFGIGLNRDIRGEYLDMINRINDYRDNSGCVVVAADIPSGIDADNGQVLGAAVKADITVAMQYACPGHLLYPGTEHCGQLIVADIGIRPIEEAGIKPTASLSYTKEKPSHTGNSHKGTYGRLYMLTGSDGMAGAACLSAESAYRTGAGLVYVDSAESNRVVLQIKVPEAVLMSWDKVKELKPTAAVAGCGLGKSKEALLGLKRLLSEFAGPIVLDADALNLLAEDEELEQKVAAHTGIIMTPHVGELSRLTGLMGAEIMSDLPKAAKLAADRYSCICVLKAARTVVAYPDKEEYFLNIAGNPGMSTAGSGDVLAGIMGGLLARGLGVEEAAVLGVLTHAGAGDSAAEQYGMSHMMARDIIAALCTQTKEWN